MSADSFSDGAIFMTDYWTCADVISKGSTLIIVD